MTKKLLSQSFKNIIPVLSDKSRVLVVFYLIAYPISLFFYIQLDGLKVPTPDTEMQRIFIMLFNAIGEYVLQIIRSILVVSVLATLFIPKEHHFRSGFGLLGNTFKQVLVERLRCVFAIAWRSLLLIIPGIYEYIRLLFVDHTVILNKDYHEGKVDALEQSRELTKGHRGPLFFVWIITLLALSFHYMLSVNIIPTGFFQHIMVFTGSFVIEVFLAIFMTSYYLELTDKNNIQFEE